jgi:predicted nucleic acid-binding protein
MSCYVVDCSVSAGWYLPDEHSEKGSQLLEGILQERDRLVEPEMWWYENLNVLRSAVLRDRITPVGARRSLSNLGRVPCELRQTTREMRALILDTALEFDLSAYDATYFVTAQGSDAKLVTQDTDLLKLSPLYSWIVSLDDLF